MRILEKIAEGVLNFLNFILSIFYLLFSAFMSILSCGGVLYGCLGLILTIIIWGIPIAFILFIILS